MILNANQSILSEQQHIERLRQLLERDKKITKISYPKVFQYVEILCDKLKVHTQEVLKQKNNFAFHKKQIETYFSEDLQKYFFNSTKDYPRNPDRSVLTHFVNSKKPTNQKDLIAMYFGYASWTGFKQNKALIDVFAINERTEKIYASKVITFIDEKGKEIPIKDAELKPSKQTLGLLHKIDIAMKDVVENGKKKLQDNIKKTAKNEEKSIDTKVVEISKKNNSEEINLPSDNNNSISKNTTKPSNIKEQGENKLIKEQENEIPKNDAPDNKEIATDTATLEKSARKKWAKNIFRILLAILIIAFVYFAYDYFKSDSNTSIPEKHTIIKDSIKITKPKSILTENKTSLPKSKTVTTKHITKPDTKDTITIVIQKHMITPKEETSKVEKYINQRLTDTISLQNNHKVISNRSGYWSLIDSKGNVIKEFKNNKPSIINTDLLIFQQRASDYTDKFGAINNKGKVIIPFKYARYTKLTNELIIFSTKEIGNVEVHIEDQDIYNSDGKLLFSECYFGSSPKFKEKLLSIAKNEKFGFLNLQGKLIIDFKYNSIEAIKNGFIVIGKGKYKRRKYGVINSKGKMIIPINYDYATIKPNNLFEVVKKNKKYIVNVKNECVKNCN
ncbi:WG repeat-containing protein [Tenacibaculum halocynthiae]|uniref:WG repeat-containing protein n=1 Tax=Tenacibaculum halocynthiae TaxID=1254437 RepID=UPI003D65FE16